MRQWQAEQFNPTGEILTPATVWQLSKQWYHNRLSPDYRSRTVAQVADIFRSLQLDSKFWYSDSLSDVPQK